MKFRYTVFLFVFQAVIAVFPLTAWGEKCSTGEWFTTREIKAVTFALHHHRKQVSKVRPPQFPTLFRLAQLRSIHRDFGGGVYKGYLYELTLMKNKTRFKLLVTPTPHNLYDTKKFYVDDKGRFSYTSDGTTPTAQSRSAKNLTGPEAPLQTVERVMGKRVRQLSRSLVQGDIKKVRREAAYLLIHFTDWWRLNKSSYPRIKGLEEKMKRTFKDPMKGLDKVLEENLGPRDMIRFIDNLPRQIRNLPTAQNLRKNLLNLIKSRKAANESVAIGTMRTLVTVNQQYRILKKSGTVPPQYATLQELVRREMIDPKLADGVKSGYRFQVTLSKKGTAFTITAIPVSPKTGTRRFFVDQTGRMTYSTKGIPNAKSRKLE